VPSTSTSTPSTTTETMTESTTTVPTTATTTMCCPQNGVWSEWTFSQPQCRDFCGSCANLTKTRTCISEASGCPCVGDASLTENCGIGVCYFPSDTCCSPYKMMVINGKHACGPQPVVGMQPPPEYINTCGVSCCPTDGIWSEWVADKPCNDTCGSCGSQTMSRKCLSTRYGCDCVGPTQKTIVCGTTVCLFPRPSCCGTYKKILDRVARTYTCGPVDNPTDPPIQPTTCCDPEGTGLWNEWSVWSNCSATCGLCGTQTRNRTCASEAYGCPCTGEATQTKKCPQFICETGDMCCSGTYQAQRYDGAYFCQEFPPEQCAGTWTEWAVAYDTPCNDTCGLCGVQPMMRSCFPSGCQCSGEYNMNQPCGAPVCLFPRVSCCPGFQKQLNRTTKSYDCIVPPSG
ncbi:hypothetical protein WR25_14705, partial [Diploscapter pachys]